MKPFAIATLLAAVATTLVPSSAVATGPSASTPVDVVLESSAGGKRAISAYRGKVVVLFYEDRAHTETNAHVKEAVARYGVAHGLAGAVAVVGVANLRAYDFFPASSFARGAIRDVATKHGIEILMDWSGAADQAIGVVNDDANVVVIDRSGIIRFRGHGALGPREEKLLLDAVSASLI
jgi:predicted transcriptional regulator